MTTTEAAAELGLTFRHITLLIRQGTIKAKKVGGDWRISRAEVMRAMGRKTKPGPRSKHERVSG